MPRCLEPSTKPSLPKRRSTIKSPARTRTKSLHPISSEEDNFGQRFTISLNDSEIESTFLTLPDRSYYTGELTLTILNNLDALTLSIHKGRNFTHVGMPLNLFVCISAYDSDGWKVGTITSQEALAEYEVQNRSSRSSQPRSQRSSATNNRLSEFRADSVDSGQGSSGKESMPQNMTNNRISFSRQDSQECYRWFSKRKSNPANMPPNLGAGRSSVVQGGRNTVCVAPNRSVFYTNIG